MNTRKPDITPKVELPRSNGLTVPEGYFADFTERMMAQLPESPKVVEAIKPKRTLWQKVRPYAYMAAMFAGIWLMMNMFTFISPSPQQSSAPILLADVSNTGTAEYVDDYLSTMSDYDLYDDLYNDGFEVPNSI